MSPGQDADPDLESQRATIEAQFRTGRVPPGVGEPRVLTESDCEEARRILRGAVSHTWTRTSSSGSVLAGSRATHCRPWRPARSSMA
jgi:hypothetical protein